MALASEQDAVQAMEDLLDGTASGDWSNTGSKPSPISRTENSERRIKEERSGEAVYIHAALEADLNKIDPAGAEVDELAVVRVECWSKTDAATAESMLRDVINIVAGKANDSNSTTAFTDWWPQSTEDFTGAAEPNRADHYVRVVNVRLRDLRST